MSGSEEVSNFRLRPGAGEAEREAGGDGGKVDGRGGGKSASICCDRYMRRKGNKQKKTWRRTSRLLRSCSRVHLLLVKSKNDA